MKSKPQTKKLASFEVVCLCCNTTLYRAASRSACMKLIESDYLMLQWEYEKIAIREVRL